MDRMNYVNMSCTTCKLSCMHCVDTSTKIVHRGVGRRGGWCTGQGANFFRNRCSFFGGEICVFRRKPVVTQPGRSRAPILHFLAPLFDQSGSSRAPICASGPVWKQLKSPKNMTKPCTNTVFNEFGCFPTVVPDSIPTGSRLPTGPPTGSMDRQEPTPAPTFPRPGPPLPFSAHQPCNQYPPILHQNGQSNLKPNGGSTKYNNICSYSNVGQTVLKLPQLQLPVVPHKAVAGSFKHRTSIGEIGCCESRMAEQIH